MARNDMELPSTDVCSDILASEANLFNRMLFYASIIIAFNTLVAHVSIMRKLRQDGPFIKRI